MALTDGNGGSDGLLTMPVAPMGNYYGGGNNGWGGGNDWLILFIILICFGGFAGNGWGGNNGAGGNSTFPWLLQGQNNTDALVTNGFQNAAIQGTLGDISNAITNGFASAEVAGCNRAAEAMQTAYNNQIANMQANFANQQALNAQLNAMQMAQQNCCCQTQAGIASLGADVAREACADRQTVSDALRDVIASNTAQTQAILDRLTQNALEAKNDTISQLRSELMYARGQASQDVQTAAIQAGQRTLANEIEQYVSPAPKPAYIVANPNCCGSYNYACGCGA